MGKHEDPQIRLLWARQYSPLFSPLNLNILREICAYYPPPYRLALLYANSLRYFNFSDQQMSEAVTLKTPIQANDQSRWAAVNDNCWVLCGGMGELHSSTQETGAGEGWRTAYLIYKSGIVQRLPDMACGHGNCGVVVWRAAVHVFGSSDLSAEKICERYDLFSAGRWQSLSNMCMGRCAFTPTPWRSVIYLCGGARNCLIEVFDGRSMRKLPLRLPEASGVVSWTHGNCLRVLSRNYICTLTAMPGVSVPTLDIQSHESSQNYPYQSPALYNDVIYCVNYPGTVYMYSATHGNKLGYIHR